VYSCIRGRSKEILLKWSYRFIFLRNRVISVTFCSCHVRNRFQYSMPLHVTKLGLLVMKKLILIIHSIIPGRGPAPLSSQILEFRRNVPSLNSRTLFFLETSASDYIMAPSHVPKDRNPQLHRCENHQPDIIVMIKVSSQWRLFLFRRVNHSWFLNDAFCFITFILFPP